MLGHINSTCRFLGTLRFALFTTLIFLICTAANAAATSTIESATYNALTGEVVITGTALNTGQSFDLSTLTFSGESGESYTLQDVSDPTPSSDTTVSFFLNNDDHLNLSRILNKNGTSPENGSPYNLSAAGNFNGSVAADIFASLVVSNYSLPTLISAAYDASTGVLEFTGTGFRAVDGINNDVIASKISIIGQGGSNSAYQFTNTPNVDVISVTKFSLPLHVDDNLHVYSLLNKNGQSADDDTKFYFSVSDDWMSGGHSAENLAQRGGLAGNTVTVSAGANDTSGTLAVSGISNVDYFVPITNSAGNFGTYSINSSGQWTYQINESAVLGLATAITAIDTFDVTGTDGAVYLMTVTITGQNDAPTATNDTASTNEDTTANNINVLTNDSDVDGDNLSVSGTPTANNGVIAVNVDNTLNYTPNINFNGTDTITYSITDGNLAATATVTVTVVAVNDAPITAIDTVTTNEDETANNINVLSNDTDADGDSLSITGTPTANSGVIAVNGDNTLNYTPNANFNGTDSITYTVTDGNLTDTASVTVTIIAVNDVPVTVNDVATTNEDVAANNINVLSNDSDVDGDNLSISGTPTANNGVVTVNGDNSLNYTPNADFNGTDTITYSITDGKLTATATVIVTVAAVNDAPITANDTVTTNEDETANNINVLSNDTDVENSALSILGTPTASNGSVVVNGDNTLNYTPNVNFNGTDSITYTVTDGTDTNTGTVAVTVSALNDAPLATNDTALTDEDTAANNINVLANDSDVDADSLSVSGTPTANNGVVSVNGDNTLNYTPNANFNGTDTLTYTITDGNMTDTATVTVTVTAVNDTPVATNDTATTNEDTLVNINVLANDSDTEGDSLNVSSAAANNGVITVNGNNTLDYAPGANFNGTDTITYTITDGNLTGTATVTITVVPVNDAPVANSDTASTNEDTAANSINVLANDSDVDADSLSVSGTPTANNGVVNVNIDNTLNYTPNANFNGADTIIYTITDGNLTNTATVTVTVTAVNDTPTLSANTASVNENSANGTAVVTMSGADVDSSDTLSYSIQTNSANVFAINSATGLITIADNSSLNYESAVQHKITIKIQDNGDGNLSTTATATINVNDIEENQTPTLITSFGTAGTGAANSFAVNAYNIPTETLIDASGRIIVSSTTAYSGTSADIGLSRFNSDGSLDTSFGSGGVVNTDLGAQETVNAIAIDASGNILAAGTQIDGGLSIGFIARYTSTGQLDTSFNSTGDRLLSNISQLVVTDMVLDSAGNIYLSGTLTVVIAGKVTSQFALVKVAADGTSHNHSTVDFSGMNSSASDIELQSDGKVLLIGFTESESNGTDFAVARFNVSPSLSLDTSFDADGKVSLDLGSGLNDVPQDSQILASGDLIVTGSSFITAGDTYSGFASVKLDANGALVPGFGTAGILRQGANQLDTSAGDANRSSAQGVGIIEDDAGDLFFAIDIGPSSKTSVIYKTNSSGVAVDNFATNGKLNYSLKDNGDFATDIDLDSSGRLLLTATGTPYVEPQLFLARFTSAGDLDTSFSADGSRLLGPTYSTDVLNEMISLTTSPNAGKYLLVGASGSGNGNKCIVTRFNTDGSLDTTFAEDGYFILQGVEQTIVCTDAAEYQDGSLFAVGSEDGQGLVIRLTASGQLDTRFDTDGIKTIAFGNAAQFKSIAIDSSNRIVLAGQSSSPNIDGIVARIDAAGSLDTTFNATGLWQIDLGLSEDFRDIALQSDGSIIVVGQRGTAGLVAKLTSGGTLDTAGFNASDGYASVDLDPVASANVDSLARLKINNDGKLVAIGSSTDSVAMAAVIQLNSDGTLDTSFDSDGIILFTPGSGSSEALDISLDSQQRPVIIGKGSNGSNDDIFISRFTKSGTNDTLFNTTGSKLFDYGASESANAILINADGSLTIAGSDNLNLYPTSFFFIQKINLVEP